MRAPSVLTRALVAAVALTAAGRAAAQSEAPVPAAPETGIRADVEFLSSEALRGRFTPSNELRVAARYIKGRLERIGMRPGGSGDDYLYAYTWPQLGVAVEAMGAKLTSASGDVELTWGQDYFLPRSSFGKRMVAGPILWARDATALAGLESSQLRGHWIVLRADAVDASQLVRAEGAGARGLVLLPTPELDPNSLEFMSQLNRAMIGPRLVDGAREGRALFPVVHVAPRASQHFEALVPADTPPGRSLPARLTEVCDYGRRDDAELENVCAWWPGSDPELAQEVVILSTHYDHRGVRRDGVVFPGADDATGTAALLAVAEALADRGPLRRSVMLLWSSAGQNKRFGSEAWTRAPSLPAGTKPVFNLHVGPVGRNATDTLQLTPTKDHPRYGALTQRLEQLAPLEGFTQLQSADDRWRSAGHINFADNLLLPVAYVTSGPHGDSSKPTDTSDKVDYGKVARAARLLLRVVEGLEGE